MITRHTALSRGGRIERGKPMRKVNRRRKVSEFARCYGSKARVEFVKSLPCAACGVVGWAENAHVTDDGTKGAGRKSGYRCIAPLCGPRPGHLGPYHPATRYGPPAFIRGCHRWLHADPDSFNGVFRLDLAATAARTEALWQSHTNERKADG